MPFITNLPRKGKLLDAIANVLPQADTLDILTSDFELIAFLILSGKWQPCGKIRVLIGTQVKGPGVQAAPKSFWEYNNTGVERFKSENDDLSELQTIKQAILSKQLEIRWYHKDPLDGSAYLAKTKTGALSGIVGSCGFSEKGLKHPLHLGGPLSSEHCKEFAQLYDPLFESGQDIGPDIITLIDRHTTLTLPYHCYLKSLYEYFRGREITAGVWEENESKVYKILSGYQRDGYRQLLHIAEKYKGALLCDGVGLGKTFVALMLIERLVHERKRVAIIVPKSTREAIWEVLVNRHIPNIRGVFGTQVVIYNHTDLLRVASGDRNYPLEMEQLRDNCDAIVIDEAHHFRNLSSQRNQKLFELTDNKLVFMLTATPINNSLFDLEHLMQFFTRQDDARLSHVGIPSLRGHLIQKEKVIEAKMGVAEGDPDAFADFDVTEAERILHDDTLFREVVVQRSRAYVKSREQLGSTQVLFPERQDPEVGEYSLKDTYGGLLDELERVFDKDAPLIKLPIYYPLAYAKKPPESVDDKKEENRQRQVVGLVRTTMLKRFESSWKSFQCTCEDLLLTQLSAVKHLDETRYAKWRQNNELLLHEIEKHIAERYGNDLDKGDIEEDDLLEDFAPKLTSLDKRLFKVRELLIDVEKDMNILVGFLGYLRGLTAEHDAKVKCLIEKLKHHPLLSKQKVIIFSEFRDTARYLAQVMKEAGIRNVFQIDSSTNVDRLEIIRRFAPFYNYDDEAKHTKALASPIRVLISTDILAEGLNLQDAFLLINYDLHWNPVRLMQRLGRVDRRMNIDTEGKLKAFAPEAKDLRGKMWFWNFLPPKELNALLSLYNRVTHKVLRISETTGLEGKKLLTKQDHFRTLQDFNASYEGQATSEEKLRLVLNKALQEDPKLEEFLVDMPWRLFSAESATKGTKGLFACYRFPALGGERSLGELKWYFIPEGSDKILTSIEQIDKHIACEPETARAKSRPLKDCSADLKKIEDYIQSHEFKKRKGMTMAQVATDNSNSMRLVAWMDVV